MSIMDWVILITFYVTGMLMILDGIFIGWIPKNDRHGE